MTITACPHCGLTMTDLRDSGLLGCGECYRTFSSELAVIFRRLHGHTRHAGKTPLINSTRIKVRQQILTLRQQLKEAIEHEEFERAAQLRDRINAIEGIQERPRPE